TRRSSDLCGLLLVVGGPVGGAVDGVLVPVAGRGLVVAGNRVGGLRGLGRLGSRGRGGEGGDGKGRLLRDDLGVDGALQLLGHVGHAVEGGGGGEAGQFAGGAGDEHALGVLLP